MCMYIGLLPLTREETYERFFLRSIFSLKSNIDRVDNCYLLRNVINVYSHLLRVCYHRHHFMH
jgi:hypothetical protein